VGLQRLARGCGNIELIRKSCKLSFHFRPLRRHGTVERDVRQPFVDFLRAIQNAGKCSVGFFLGLEYLEHISCLISKALDGLVSGTRFFIMFTTSLSLIRD